MIKSVTAAIFVIELLTHNNLVFEDWVSKLQNTKKIYIELDSCFIQYRLNYMLKLPNWNKKLNDYAIENSWKKFKNSIPLFLI